MNPSDHGQDKIASTEVAYVKKASHDQSEKKLKTAASKAVEIKRIPTKPQSKRPQGEASGHLWGSEKSSLHKAVEYDWRLINRSGWIEPKQLDSFFASLPDVSARGEWVDAPLPSEEKKSKDEADASDDLN